LMQDVATIWDGMDAWPTGTYTLLWDGLGDFTVWGSITNLVKVNANRYEFEVVNTVNGVLELRMIQSDINDPVHNMRVLLPGTESTYMTQPFNQEWLDGLDPFSTIRFMDWGHTNNWGQGEDWTSWNISNLAPWSERAQLDYFGQTQWLNEYGCVQTGTSWPEGLVPYIQNALDLWSASFVSEMDRITRVVGVQTGWLDVSERICYNMAPNSIDAISPTFYFGFTDAGETDLDILGASATVL